MNNRTQRRGGTGSIPVALLLGFALNAAPLVAEDCPYTCGDFTGDHFASLDDYQQFEACLGASPEAAGCACADLDGSGSIDLRDFAIFTRVFPGVSDEAPPACTGAAGSLANMTAYRPRHGSGYFPFTRTAIAEADEEDAVRGPGIRANGAADIDAGTEDDLIEVVVSVNSPGGELALRRTHPALHVWTTPTREAGTEIPFDGDRTATLPMGMGAGAFTIWVAWESPDQGEGLLQIEPTSAAVARDTLRFHTFNHVVLALGGENQVPSIPVDPGHGTFVVAHQLYSQGYDVHLYDEDVVGSDGAGAAYNEAATAIRERGATNVAIFGYSHGGGSTHDLADRLDANRAGLGVFEIRWTSYVDAVDNASDISVGQELRRPPSTLFHLNHYQHGTLLEDFFLDGGPVTNSNPPPTGLDVETTAWGASSTHFTVDDYTQVRSLMASTFSTWLTTLVEALGGASNEDGTTASAVSEVSYATPALVVDPELQEAFGAASGEDDQTSAAYWNLLQASADADTGNLIRQLVLFSSKADNTRDAMLAGAVFDRLGFSQDTVVEAAAPMLGSGDRDVEGMVRSILAGYEGRRPGASPDFSRYRALLAEQFAGGEPFDAGLARHMYDADAGEALRVMIRVHGLRDPAAIKPLLLAAHSAEDALWREANGFVEDTEAANATATARTTVGALADDDRWWVRLYAASTMTQHALLREEQTLATLQKDVEPLVRQAATSTP